MELKTRTTSGRRVERKPSKKDLPETFEKGRVCKQAGCTTLLSIYHLGPNCHAHEAKRFPPILTTGQLERVMDAVPSQREELEILMAEPGIA